jgi:hypothetical protein
MSEFIVIGQSVVRVDKEGRIEEPVKVKPKAKVKEPVLIIDESAMFLTSVNFAPKKGLHGGDE